MKPISEMNLSQLAGQIEGKLEVPIGYHLLQFDIADRLRELHEQSRWIPVKERLPTKKDADENGNVLVCSFDLDSGKLCYESWVFTDVTVQGGTQYKPRYWKRIDKPEGV